MVLIMANFTNHILVTFNRPINSTNFNIMNTKPTLLDSEYSSHMLLTCHAQLVPSANPLEKKLKLKCRHTVFSSFFMFSAFPSSLTFSHLSQPIYLSLLLLPLSVDPCMRAQNKRNISAATEYSNHILYNHQSVTLTSLHNYADMLADAKKTIELNPTGDWSKGHSCIGAAYLELKCCHIVFLFLLYILCLPLLPYSHLSQPSYFSPFDCSPLIYA